MTALQTRVRVEGHCEPRFEPVRAAFAGNFASGADVGACVAVTIDGELVVDLWGGYLDEARTAPWREDNIVSVFSTTKTMCALCALLLADRGEIDLDAPVARYWPAFAANGKDGVLVRHLLGHTAGLPGLDTPMHRRRSLRLGEDASASSSARRRGGRPGRLRPTTPSRKAIWWVR